MRLILRIAMDGNIISIREFARRVSSSEGNIRKAIKARKIVNGIKDGKILFDVALEEYKAWYGHKMPEVLIMPVEKKKVEKVKPIKKEFEVKTVEVVKEVIKEIPVKPITPITETLDVDQENESIDVSDDKPIRIRNATKYEEAKRLEQVIKTRTAQLEYEQLKGSLVSSKEVYKELFAVGQVVRTALQGIPDKYIDVILACDNRSEAHEILTKAITQSLEELSNATKDVEL